MSKTTRLIFIFLLTASFYHTIRDILQIIEVHNWFTDILSYKHNWCNALGPFCNYYLFPWEILTFTGSIFVLKINRFSLLGKLVLYAQIIVPISWILNWTVG